MQFVMEMLTME